MSKTVVQGVSSLFKRLFKIDQPMLWRMYHGFACARRSFKEVVEEVVEDVEDAVDDM